MAIRNVFAAATRSARKEYGLTNDNTNIDAGVSVPIAITASGAIDPHTNAQYVITKSGVAAMTLGAPVSGTEDGTRIYITSNTANAHTITATGLFQCGTAAVNLATFAAFAGAGVVLVAYQGKWLVESNNIVTFS